MPNSALPKQFHSLEYVKSMQPYVGITMDNATQEQVSKLMDVAYAMAQVVYEVPLDDNHCDLANVFIPGDQP